mgnify:CR=1 FL=1
MAIGDISPERVSFGNTIKKARDIARVFNHGIRLFAFDSRAELAKLKKNAPGSSVFCRIFMDGAGADWPLSRKFGCEPDLAIELLTQAAEDGLHPAGVSFHVGSQQRNLAQWDVAIERAAMVFSELGARGIELELLNMGGGFPAKYRQDIEPVENYGEVIRASIVKHFGNKPPRIIAEPGRRIAGAAGRLQTEDGLVAGKPRGQARLSGDLSVGTLCVLPGTTADENI